MATLRNDAPHFITCTREEYLRVNWRITFFEKRTDPWGAKYEYEWNFGLTEDPTTKAAAGWFNRELKVVRDFLEIGDTRFETEFVPFPPFPTAEVGGDV